MRIRKGLSAAVVAVVFVSSACTDRQPTAPQAGPEALVPRLAATTQEGSPRGLDAAFVRIAQDLPRFAGMYYDTDGRLTVRMAGGAGIQSAADIARGLATTLQAGGRPVPAEADILVVEAEYDFLQLNTWNQRALGTLSLDGVLFTSIDESANRVRIGVEDASARSQVEQALDGMGIPAEAVIIELAEPIQFAATLRDRVRPLAGGLQIVFERPGVGFFLCTLGSNVLVPGGPGRSQPHFITNSHCAAEQGNTTGTTYWQHLPPQFIAPPAPPTAIATETNNPAYFTGAPCPAGRACRFSDALLARYGKGGIFEDVSVNFGSIYRTTGFGMTTPGSLEIPAVDPRFRIVADAPFPLGGETLNKVGRTTGWSRGPVVFTCVNVNVAGTNFTLFCQDIVVAAVAGGDSGSPVFQQLGETRDVTFFGLLWGSGTVGGLPIFVFSAVENIEFELGVLQTH